MSQIGALSVKIGADTKDLTKGLSSAKGEIGGLDKSIKDMLPSIKQIAIVATAAAAALGVMVKRAIDTADNMGKAAQKVGVTTEELSKLEYAAKLANVSSGELQSSLMRLTKGMSDAAQGTGEAQKGFSALGIQVKASDGSLKSSTQIMGEVADQFAGMRDGAEKTALAISIFGRAGANMIPLLNGGSKAIREAGDELERMGGVVTADAARQAEQFNDNITRLKETFSGLVMQLANRVLPSLTAFTEKILAAIRHGLDLGAVVRLMFSGDEEARLAKINARLAEFAVLAQKGRMGLSQVLDEQSLMKEKKALEDVIRARQDSLNKLKELEENLARPAGPSLDENERQKKLAEERKQMLQELADQEAANEQKRRDDIFATLEARRLSYATQNELELERYALELQNLMDAKQAQFLTEEQYRVASEEAATRHEENLTNIAKREAEKRANLERQTQAAITSARASAVQEGIGFLNAFAGKSKAAAVAAVALNKALAIAQIIQNTAVAQMRALAELGPIAGPPAAAKIGMYGKIQAGIAAATGLMQVAGAAAGGGGANISPVGVTSGGVQTGTQSDGTSFGGTQTRMTPQTVTIQLQGEVFGREQIRELISQINEAVSDGSVLRLQ
jgi:hypothetical protein